MREQTEIERRCLKWLPSVRRGSGWRYYFAEDVEQFRRFVEEEPSEATEAPSPRRRRSDGGDFWGRAIKKE
jgi:hypothetical protein